MVYLGIYISDESYQPLIRELSSFTLDRGGVSVWKREGYSGEDPLR